MGEEFEVCVSYSRKNTEFVARVVAALEKANVKVFWDKKYEATLWGRNLRRELAWIYSKARFCVVFFSADYCTSVWTQWELDHAGKRALDEDSLLPLRLDDTEPPGELSEITWLDVGTQAPETIAEHIVAKVRGKEVLPRARTPWQQFKDYVRYRVWHIAAVLALLVSLGGYGVWRNRPSDTTVYFDHDTPDTLVVHVQNSGGRPSQLTGARLRFHELPLRDTELRMVRGEPRTIEPGVGGTRNFLPSGLGLQATSQFDDKAELRGEVTLEYDVKESNDAIQMRSERLPVGRMRTFIEKWVPDEP